MALRLRPAKGMRPEGPVGAMQSRWFGQARRACSAVGRILSAKYAVTPAVRCLTCSGRVAAPTLDRMIDGMESHARMHAGKDGGAFHEQL